MRKWRQQHLVASDMRGNTEMMSLNRQIKQVSNENWRLPETQTLKWHAKRGKWRSTTSSTSWSVQSLSSQGRLLPTHWVKWSNTAPIRLSMAQPRVVLAHFSDWVLCAITCWSYYRGLWIKFWTRTWPRLRGLILGVLNRWLLVDQRLQWLTAISLSFTWAYPDRSSWRCLWRWWRDRWKVMSSWPTRLCSFWMN